jgi:hypothetical protein
MHRFAVGMFAIAYGASASKSASIDSEAQYQYRKACVAEPDIGIWTQEVLVDRQAYKALIELQALRCQHATKSRVNTQNKFTDVEMTIREDVHE